MEDICSIYIDRLSEETSEFIQLTLPSSFMGIQEAELSFPSPITVAGQAYIASSHLIIKLDITTDCLLPCAWCNELFSYAICIKNSYISIPLEEINGRIFDFGPILRENILLEIPSFAKCSLSTCIEPTFLKQEKKKSTEVEQNSYFPFANLDS